MVQHRFQRGFVRRQIRFNEKFYPGPIVFERRSAPNIEPGEQYSPVVGEDEDLSQYAPVDSKRQFIIQHPYWPQLESQLESSQLCKVSSLLEL